MKVPPDVLTTFRNFCANFLKYDIFEYKDGDYFNALGNNDEFAFKDGVWEETETLRAQFEQWLLEEFQRHHSHDFVLIIINFETETLKLYHKILTINQNTES